jgi:predicted phage-related endonuclease
MKTIDRTRILGGTDAAVVLGVSDWKTPLELWQEKVGLRIDEASEALERIRERGRELEPFILKIGVRKLRDEGHDVEVLAKNKRYRHPTFPFLSVEIDAELLLDGERINFDAKSVTWQARKQWGETGTDAMPIAYLAQFMLGLDVTPGNRQRTAVAALRSFDDVDIYWAERDQETIDAMREKLVDFWQNHVKKRVPPDPVKFGDIRALFPEDNSRSIEATDAIVEKVARLREVLKSKRELEGEEERLRFDIAEYIGPHALLTHGTKNLMTWESSPQKRLDEKSFKRDHPDWYALYMKQTTIRALRFAAKR